MVTKNKGGKPRNTARETKILQMLGKGFSVNTAAKSVGVHRNTVTNTVKRIGVAVPVIALQSLENKQAAIEEIEAEEQSIRDLLTNRLELTHRIEQHRQNLHLLRNRIEIAEITLLLSTAKSAFDKAAIAFPVRSPNLRKKFYKEDTRTASPLVKSLEKERTEIVDLSIKNLSSVQRAVIKLVFWEHNTVLDASQKIGHTEQETQSILDAAMEAMRRSMVALE